MSENFKCAINKLLHDSYAGNRSRMAADLGFSPQQVAGWVAGKTVPKPQNLAVVAKKIGVSSDELLNGTAFLRPDPLLEKLNDLERRVSALERSTSNHDDAAVREVLSMLATASEAKKSAALVVLKSLLEG